MLLVILALSLVISSSSELNSMKANLCGFAAAAHLEIRHHPSSPLNCGLYVYMWFKKQINKWLEFWEKKWIRNYKHATAFLTLTKHVKTCNAYNDTILLKGKELESLMVNM